MADDKNVGLSEGTINTNKVFFKKKKPIRSRRKSLSEEDADEDDKDILSKVEEMKTIQKLRTRPHGVSLAELALGIKTDPVEEVLVGSKDPLKIQSGGLVHMKDVKSGSLKAQDDAYEVGIGTQFSAETNKRDEDEEMMKYIEEKLSERKRKNEKGDEKDEKHNLFCSPEDAALQALPEHLKHASSVNRSEEMLSNQMLSGIPEVDLGIEAKIKNIEATEEARLKLMKDKKSKKEAPSQFVPSNVTVNFAQPNKINVEESIMSESAGSNAKRKAEEKATDDFYYERFKKQFKRF